MAGAAAPVLETPRLRLRAHRPGDFEACHALWSDPEVVRYVTGQPATAEQAWDRMLRYAGMWSLFGHGLWAVEEKHGGRYLGDVGCADFKRDIEPSLAGMLEFAWVLASAAQGRGYAGEAVAAVQAWAATHHPGRRWACLISEGNQASVKLAGKMGFRFWQATAYRGEAVSVFLHEAGAG
jgi:RimJ/RimL family protein N-acetyltransferase